MENQTQTPQTETPAVSNIRPIVISGRKVAFESLVNARGKGEDKGAPVLLVKYAVANSPAFSEIVGLATVLGDGFLAKAIHSEILRPLFIAASKETRVKNPDGTWSVDEGKFAQRVVSLLQEWCVSQSAKAQIESELAEIAQAISAFTGQLIDRQMKGEKVSPDELNRASQLLLKQAELQAKLAKKTKKPAAAPAAK